MASSDCCPRCQSDKFDDTFENFDALCIDCGVVIQNWENADKLQETIEPPIEIGATRNDAQHSWLDYCSVQNSTEHQVAKAIDTLESLSDALSLSSDCRKLATEYFCKASIDGLTDGRSTNAVVASLLHCASRQTDETRPLKAFGELVEEDESAISSFTRFLQRELDIEQPPAKPSSYLDYVQNELALGDVHVEQCEAIIGKFEATQSFVGKHPLGVVAAVIYEVSDGEFTQRELAQRVGVTKETIRQRLHDIRRSDDSYEVKEAADG